MSPIVQDPRVLSSINCFLSSVTDVTGVLDSPPDFNIPSQGLQMRFVVKRLLLGLVLIVSASVALLLSDLGRRTAVARSMPHIGLLQHASTMLLDEGTRGAIDGLAEKGFVDGKTIVISTCLPEMCFARDSSWLADATTYREIKDVVVCGAAAVVKL